MERIQNILHQEDYCKYLKNIAYYEMDREYCHHDISHFLDVARIAYIYNLEHNLLYSKEIIYAVGLLHDIGKFMQYKDGIAHNLASATLAIPLLKTAGFDENETDEICIAIKNHRKYDIDDNSLSFVTWYADKKSRNCFCCNANESCNWSNEKKNKSIIY